MSTEIASLSAIFLTRLYDSYIGQKYEHGDRLFVGALA